jgi:hypothetical protein
MLARRDRGIILDWHRQQRLSARFPIRIDVRRSAHADLDMPTSSD